MSDDQIELLQLLNAHGQTFLDSFGEAVHELKSKRTEESQTGPGDNGSDEEEWGGINESDEEASDGSETIDENDDDITAESRSHPSNVVVFSESTKKDDDYVPPTKQQMKAFMSSRVSKIREDTANMSEKTKNGDEEEELSHLKNDALLHRLVHTQLLSGSLNPDLNLAPAQRRKALEGRVMELSGKSKLGRGEKNVRTTEHKRAAKHVRDGLMAKKQQREKAQLEEAKELGNYHPKLKRLYDPSEEGRPAKKRSRGIGMGVGKFQGGILRLSQSEISQVNGRGRGSSRGKGRRK